MAKIYEITSKFYDELVGDTFRVRMLPVRKWLLKSVSPLPCRLLDLACGTGSAAVDYARLGADVTAADINKKFVEISKRRFQKEKVKVQAVQADMRNFKFAKTFDIVTCNYDSLNHLSAKRELKQVLKSVSNALKPGGHFFFDVFTPFAHEHLWPHWHGISAQENWNLFYQGSFDSKTRRGHLKAIYFLRNRTGLFAREIEDLWEISWSPQEIIEALRETGFRIVSATDAPKITPGEAPKARMFYLTQRK